MFGNGLSFLDTMTQDNLFTGWISLYRSIQKHWIWNKGALTDFEAWVMILLECNHKEKKVRLGNEIFTCGIGESLNSLDHWSKLFKWNKSKTRRFLELLENDQMIERKPTHKTTHLKVCNYEFYQNFRHADETQVKRKRNASETHLTPNNNDNNVNNVNKWYSSQMELCKREEGYEYYKEFVDCLFGNNSTSEPLKAVLKMDQQVSYKQYLKIHNDTIDLGVEYEPILVAMNNWKKLSNNTSVQATLLNWMKREVKA